jgi:hypothetical protein
MADVMRSETVRLLDGRSVVVRPTTMADAESTLRNVKRVGAEEVFIRIEEAPSLEEEPAGCPPSTESGTCSSSRWRMER